MIVYSTAVSPLYFFTIVQTETVNTGVDMPGKSSYSTIILYIQTDPDEKSMETLSTNLQLARLVGVQGTPATIIGDEMIPGAVSWETLEEVVKEKLAVAHAQ